MTFASIVVGFIVLFLLASIKILNEYERGVVFLLGRFQRVKGPGIIIVVPVIQQMIRTDLGASSRWMSLHRTSSVVTTSR